MSKKNKFIFWIILLFTICIISICIYYVYNNKGFNNDALNFQNEYMKYNDKGYYNVFIDNNNSIKYKSAEEIVNLLDNEKAIIYFGYPTSESCRSIVSTITELGNELKSTIYYLNIDDIRTEYAVKDKKIVKEKNGSSSYYKILNILNDYLNEYYVDGYNTSEKRIMAPTIVAVDKGKVTGFYCFNEGEDIIISSEKLDSIKKEIKKVIMSNNIDVCTKDGC